VSAPLIDHVGILVDDLETAIERWSAVTGYSFSPIGRYRTRGYSDESSALPHDHDARFSLSREGAPHIELLEVTGEGSHSARHLGVHHIAMRVHDAAAERTRVEALGYGVDTWNTTPDGRVHICFTERSALDGMALEFISAFPGPIVLDSGEPAWRDPQTGRASLWGAPA
jgi:catechol 2,3-dioxygenase-like lactoylglutathione lyase family enzyme